MAGSKSSSEPQASIDGARSETSATGRRAPAGKVKVAGVWASAAELTKPAASRSSSKPSGSSPKKKGGSERRAEGHDEPIKIYNSFGSFPFTAFLC